MNPIDRFLTWLTNRWGPLILIPLMAGYFVAVIWFFSWCGC